MILMPFFSFSSDSNTTTTITITTTTTTSLIPIRRELVKKLCILRENPLCTKMRAVKRFVVNRIELKIIVACVIDIHVQVIIFCYILYAQYALSLTDAFLVIVYSKTFNTLAVRIFRNLYFLYIEEIKTIIISISTQ